MQHLALSPLPCADAKEKSCGMAGAQLGYVDDEVVMTLLAGVVASHPSRDTAWLPVAPDQMDYAGWTPMTRSESRFSHA